MTQSERSKLLRTALDLWRGSPFADLNDQTALLPEITRLEALRVSATGLRVDAELALGRHTTLVGELEALVNEYPLHEQFRAQLMLALYRSGRHVEALRSYERHRAHLGEELGLEPSNDLRELEAQILSSDAALGIAYTDPSAPTSIRGYELRGRLDSDGDSLVHRAYQRSLGTLR